MHILLLGCSKLVKSRIIPFLADVTEIEKVDVAAHSSQTREELDTFKDVAENLFHGFELALNNSEADVVYISIVNSAHAYWAEQFLIKGFHVIVDKPAFTSFDDAKRLVGLAKAKNLCLVEANVYLRHPQIETLMNLLQNTKIKPTRLFVAFSFPPLNSQNFRYKRALGGGAIFDTAPYAVSIAQLIFGDQPQNIICKINSFDEAEKLELSYSLMMTYSNGRSMVGHFGFDTEYINRLIVFGENFSLDVDRVFTTTPSLKNEIRVKSKNESKVILCESGNSFVLFLKEVINVIESNTFDHYYDELIKNSEIIDIIKKSAEYEPR